MDVFFFPHQDQFRGEITAAQADFRVGINLINLTVLGSMVKECDGIAVDNSKDRNLQ